MSQEKNKVGDKFGAPSVVLKSKKKCTAGLIMIGNVSSSKNRSKKRWERRRRYYAVLSQYWTNFKPS